MTTAPTMAVTGSTGELGGKVAALLGDVGVPLRLLVRDPQRAPRIPESTVARFSYADDDVTAKALRGVETLFMVSAAESDDRRAQHLAFVDAAQAAGVEHIVYTSFVGAAPDATFTLARDHWATEEHIRASGMQYTFLRDNFYLDLLPHLVGADGVIRGPAGDGRVAAVARHDVARTAAAVLGDPGSHRGATHELTGPAALGFEEIAEALTATTGRQVSYRDETVEEAYESRRRWPAPQWQYDAWVSTYTAIAAGELATVTPAVYEVTGREPESFHSLLVSAEVRSIA